MRQVVEYAELVAIDKDHGMFAVRVSRTTLWVEKVPEAMLCKIATAFGKRVSVYWNEDDVIECVRIPDGDGDMITVKP